MRSTRNVRQTFRGFNAAPETGSIVIEILHQQLQALLTQESFPACISVIFPFTTPQHFPLPEDPQGLCWSNYTGQHRKEHPERIASISTAWQATASGEGRFQTIQQQFSELQKNWAVVDHGKTGIKPRLFFQYAFAEEDPMQKEWKGFENTKLVLPRLMLIQQEGKTALIFSHTCADGAIFQATAKRQKNFARKSQLEAILKQWIEDLATLQRDFVFIEKFHEKNSVQECKNAPENEAEIKTKIKKTIRKPKDEVWLENVRRVVRTIHRLQNRFGMLEKVVYSQSQTVCFEEEPDVVSAFKNLEQRAKNGHGSALWIQNGTKILLAAPPERLLRKTGNTLHCDALAGTVPRGESLEEKEAQAEQLLFNSKLRHEHHLVVEAIRKQLAPLSQTMDSPGTPTVRRLHTLAHLYTPITAILEQKHSIFELIPLLHQNPAICGTSQYDALAWLKAHKDTERGLYSGGIGWLDADGDGEIFVLLRCALLEETMATFYAGAGIIGNSVPEEELQEIHLKVNSVLDAFCV